MRGTSRQTRRRAASFACRRGMVRSPSRSIASRPSDISSLAAPDRLPGAGTGAAGSLALPAAASGNARQPALAGGLITGRRDADPDGAVARHLTLQSGLGGAVGYHGAVDDLHAEPILRIAGTALRVDRDAPHAVIGIGHAGLPLGGRHARRRPRYPA